MAKKARTRKPTPAPVKAYLILYNLFCVAGWCGVLALTGQHISANGAAGLEDGSLWKVIEVPLKIVQTAAFMEILHCREILGFVPSTVGSTFTQVFSRLAVVWGVNDVSPASVSSWMFAMMILSWCTVEIPRYLFYVVNVASGGSESAMPAWLHFLRYSLFAVLYPTGITGEVSCFYRAFYSPADVKAMSTVVLPWLDPIVKMVNPGFAGVSGAHFTVAALV